MTFLKYYFLINIIFIIIIFVQNYNEFHKNLVISEYFRKYFWISKLLCLVRHLCSCSNSWSYCLFLHLNGIVRLNINNNGKVRRRVAVHAIYNKLFTSDFKGKFLVIINSIWDLRVLKLYQMKYNFSFVWCRAVVTIQYNTDYWQI